MIRIRRLLNGTPPSGDRSPVWIAAAVVVTLGILLVASGHVTEAEAHAIPSMIVRADIHLSGAVAPPKTLGPEHPAAVAPAPLTIREQGQPQAPPSPAPGPPATATPAPDLRRSTVVEMYRVSQARNALPTIAPYVISAGDILGLSVLQDLKLFDDILVNPMGM